MSNILFTFETEDQRDQFLRFLSDLDEKEYIRKILSKIELNTTSIDRYCALWISGKKISEGSFNEINKSFNAEILAHSASVSIKEKRNGEWTTIRSRKNRLIQT